MVSQNLSIGMPFTRNNKKQTENRHRVVLCIVVTTILFLCCVNARLTLKELERVQSKRIGNSPEQVVINPDGPLNLLRGYIYKECGFMHNKRLFAPEIEIRYTLEQEDFSDCISIDNLCIFKRNIADGKLNELLCLPDSNTNAYYRTLLQLFPSVDNNNIAINSADKNSLTDFLREDKVKKDAYYYLATLLLLSEGIDLPIEYTGEISESTGKKISLKKTSGKGYFFDIDTKPPVLMDISTKTQGVVHMDPVQVIRFFKSNAKNKKEEPKSIEELKKGDFLDTPQFLIQTYLFEFLESVEEINQFNEAVYNILCDVYPEKESMQVDNPDVEEKLSPVLKKRKIERQLSSSLSKYFLSSSDSVEINKAYLYLQEFEKIRLLVGRQDVFPFSYKHLVAHTIKATLHNNSYINLENESGLFENTVETQLYIFFCCLLYNPKTGKYSLDKIEKPTEELKEFFTKYNKPVESTTYRMLEQWTNVVSDLTKNEFVYLKNRKVLQPGVFNFFLVVANLTGLSDQEKKLVDFRNELKKADNNDKFSLEEFYTGLCKCLEEMLRLLCVSNMTKIDCSLIYPILERSTYTMSEIEEILEHFQIEFTNSESRDPNKNPYIALELRKKFTIHSNINIKDDFKMRDIDAKKVKAAENQLTAKKEKCFMDLLLIQYIENMMLTANKKLEIFGEKGIVINELLDNNLKGINRIFLLRKIEDLEYKEFVVGCFLSCAKTKKVNSGSEFLIKRFILNIIGSLFLNDFSTQEAVLRPLLYTDYSLGIYPSPNLPGKFSTPDLDIDSPNALKGISYILYTMSTGILIRILKEHGFEEGIKYSIFSYIDGISSIFDCLFNDNNIDGLKSLFSPNPNTDDSYDKSDMNDIFFVCLVIACQRKKEHPAFILDLYDCIDPQLIQDNYSIYDTSCFFDFHQKSSKDFSEVMTAMEKELVEREGKKEKFDEVLKFFNANLELEKT